METKFVVRYLICGILTTLVNMIIYYSLTRLVSVPYLMSNAIAWIMSVLFAYITNRRFVFKIKTDKTNSYWDKLPHFFASRLLSGVIDMGSMFLLVTILSLDDNISKILVSVFVIVINYLISKFIIFT